MHTYFQHKADGRNSFVCLQKFYREQDKFKDTKRVSLKSEMHSSTAFGLLHFFICAQFGQNEILSCSEHVMATNRKQASVFDDFCFVLFVIVHVDRNNLTSKIITKIVFLFICGE